MKILATGSRKWTNVEVVRSNLFTLKQYYGNPAEARVKDVLIHGDCPDGLDQIIDKIARDMGFDVHPYRVDTKIDGPWPGAGTARNSRMLKEEHTKDFPIRFTVAFPTPESKGTWDMIKKSNLAKIRVIIVPLP